MVAMYAKLAALLVAGGLCQSALAQYRPAALLALEDSRLRLKTGVVEWSKVDNSQGGSEIFWTSRFAGKDISIACRGDATGVVSRRPDQTPGLGNGVHYRLFKNGELWVHEEFSGSAELHPGGRGGLPDARNIGVFPFEAPGALSELLWRSLGSDSDVKFVEDSDGELVVVSAEQGFTRTQFWLDPRRGWNPVRVTRTEGDGMRLECRVTLRDFSGVWFPCMVEFRDSKFRDGREPRTVVKIQSARFNHPDDPQELSPQQIGVDVGTMIKVLGADRRDVGVRFWDGKKAAPQEEYFQRLNSGELKEGPLHLAALEWQKRRIAADPIMRPEVAILEAKQRATGAYSWKKCEGLWEAETKQFIRKHQLNDEQVQRALLVLRKCQDDAGAVVASRRAEFELLEHEEVLLKSLQEPEFSRRLGEFRRALADAMGPLDRIHDERLLPELRKIPTRAQLSAATQPATPDRDGK